MVTGVLEIERDVPSSSIRAQSTISGGDQIWRKPLDNADEPLKTPPAPRAPIQGGRRDRRRTPQDAPPFARARPCKTPPCFANTRTWRPLRRPASLEIRTPRCSVGESRDESRAGTHSTTYSFSARYVMIWQMARLMGGGETKNRRGCQDAISESATSVNSA